MTEPLVLIPWQNTGCTHRHAALRHVHRHWWNDHAYPSALCVLAPNEPWRKASALAAAMADAPPVVIIADADCLVDPVAVRDCVRIVAESGGWAIPHWRVVRLTRAASEALYENGSPYLGDGVQTHEQEPYLGVAAGGVIVIASDLAKSVPMDATYTDWGGEDYSWGMALDTIHGPPYRPEVHTDLIHLYHPRHTRAGHGTNVCSDEDRRHAYFAAWAAHDVDAMRDLVEGGRVWPQP